MADTLQQFQQAEYNLLDAATTQLTSIGIPSDYLQVNQYDYIVVRLAEVYKSDTRFPKPSSTDPIEERVKFTFDNYPETLFMKMSVLKELTIAQATYNMYSYKTTTKHREYNEWFNGTSCYHIGQFKNSQTGVVIGPPSEYVQWVKDSIDGKIGDLILQGSESLPATVLSTMYDCNTTPTISEGLPTGTVYSHPQGHPSRVVVSLVPDINGVYPLGTLYYDDNYIDQPIMIISPYSGKTINTATDIEYTGLQMFRSVYSPMPVAYDNRLANGQYAGDLKSDLGSIFTGIKIYILNHGLFKFQNEGTPHGSTIVIPLPTFVGYMYNRKARLASILGV